MSTAFVSLSSVLTAVSLYFHPAPPSPSLPATMPTPRVVEIRRIQAHFDSVLHTLPSRDVATLTASQRARRGAVLATLQRYRDAGVFPHNYDFPGQPTPYFVDRKTGVLCAVAHLLESTGRRDIVDRVAAADNNVYVAELAGDTAFAGWLATHGLTLEEAAFIQVPYMGDPMPIIIEPRPASSNTSYTIGSAMAIGSSLAASLWTTRGNADGHRGLSSIVGLVASAASIGVGAVAISDPSAPRAVAPLSLLAGGVSTYLSTRGLLRHRAYQTARRDAAQQQRTVSTSVSPILPVAGVSGAGLAFRLTF
jgi:hypothetical protein